MGGHLRALRQCKWLAHGHVSSSFFACGVFASQVSGWRTGVDDHAPAVLLHHQKKPSGLVS